MIFRFPGAKSKLLPLLRPYIDRLVAGQGSFHDVFVGSGTVLLDTARRHPKLDLSANDGDAGVSAFWRTVSGKSVASLCERILGTKPTLSLFRQIQASTPSKPEDLAFRFFFLNRTTFSGMLDSGPLGGGRQNHRKLNCRWVPQKSAREIMEAHHLLRGRLTVSCESGSEYVAAKVAEPLFLDPPYFSRGDRLYPRKMTFAEHLRLSRLLQNGRQWVMTFDDNPVVHKLYSWACIHVIPARYHIESCRPRRAAAQELVITP